MLGYINKHRIIDLVHAVGEAVEVVDGVVTVNDVDGGDGGLPVAGDDEDGIGAGGEDLVLP